MIKIQWNKVEVVSDVGKFHKKKYVPPPKKKNAILTLNSKKSKF